MSQTIFGPVLDELGHGLQRILTQGPERPEVRTRSWALPASQVRDVQGARIRVDRDHDGDWCGEVLHLERRRGSGLMAVASVSDDVVPAVYVRVGEERKAVEVPLYFSASWSATPDYRDVTIESLALTCSPAQVGLRPLTFLRGGLDYPGAERRWQLDGAARELLGRAAYSARERHSGAPIVIYDEEGERVELVAEGTWRYGSELYSERRERDGTFTDPAGRPLRWRTGRILSVS
jgi:hypothetical protein